MAARTVGDAIRGELPEMYDLDIQVADVCAALGVPPETPLSALHVLTDGQHVVEMRVPEEGETVMTPRGMYIAQQPIGGMLWPVVVRSAGCV